MHRRKNALQTVLIVLLLLGNIIGAIFGFTWWYGEQLLNAPWYLWIFTAPSPMYAALFVLCAIMLLLNTSNSGFVSSHPGFSSLLFFITSVGLIKYGIWTVVFWLTFPGAAELGTLMIVWLAFSHGMMALESSLIYHRIRFKKYGLAALFGTLAFFLLNDYLDYVGPTMMTKIAIPHMDIASVTAFTLTLIAPFLVYFIAKKVRKPVLKLF
jgi:uncharacterized membrane protein YpjA